MFDEENDKGSSSPLRPALGISKAKLNVRSTGDDETDVQVAVDADELQDEEDDVDDVELGRSRPVAPNSIERTLWSEGRKRRSVDAVRRIVFNAERKAGRERPDSEEVNKGIMASS